MSAVIVRDLRKSFGEFEALRGVSFEVPEQTVLGLLGPNGAGKTTTVNILTTLLRADSGTAIVDGINVAEDPAATRSRIGLTGQYAAVDERLSGVENLQLVGQFFHLSRAEAKKRAHELLGQFDLRDAGDRVVKGYSGGMRRRLDIAMSLIAHPTVLFLDEPTTGLDPRSRLDMWELIQNLVAHGTTTVLTTQYLEEAEYLADNIVVIDHGKVIAEGTATELKAQSGSARLVISPAHEDALTVIPQLLERFALAHVEPEIDQDARSVTLAVAETRGVVPAAVRSLDDAGIEVVDVSVRHPTLDDVFLQLTGKPAEEGSDLEGSHQ